MQSELDELKNNYQTLKDLENRYEETIEERNKELDNLQQSCELLRHQNESLTSQLQEAVAVMEHQTPLTSSDDDSSDCARELLKALRTENIKLKVKCDGLEQRLIEKEREKNHFSELAD